MQHLASLQSCQGQVAAAENISRQKRHTAAAAAAVEAVQFGIDPEDANMESDDVEDPAAEVTQTVKVVQTRATSVQLPDQVTCAAAAAANRAASSSATSTYTVDNTAVLSVPEHRQYIRKAASPSEHATRHTSPLPATPSAGQLPTDYRTAPSLNPYPIKQGHEWLHADHNTEAQSLLGYIGGTGGGPGGWVSQEIVQKQLQVMSVCHDGLCREVSDNISCLRVCQTHSLFRHTCSCCYDAAQWQQSIPAQAYLSTSSSSHVKSP